MLTSIVLILKPEKNCLVPPTLGNYCYASFLNLVRGLDEELATELHRSGGDKPFTLSSLQGEFIPEADKLLLQSAGEYWLRITAIDHKLSELLNGLSAEDIGKVTIGDAELNLVRIAKNNRQHHWAQNTTFKDLYNSWVADATRVPKRIKLRFYSPTTFRSGGQNIPLPLPKLVFLQLMRKWNRYSPVLLGEDIAEIAENRVMLSHYELKTQMLDFGKYRQVGFVGDCEFLLRAKRNEIWSRVLHLLADFAFFAGVGYKTTMGMGQVRRVTSRSSLKTA